MEQLDLNVDGIIVIRGTVENVVYHSEDTGYGVFDIEDENEDEDIPYEYDPDDIGSIDDE